jgi:coenzyme F420-reducing hydrogenase delta subunit
LMYVPLIQVISILCLSEFRHDIVLASLRSKADSQQ